MSSHGVANDEVRNSAELIASGLRRVQKHHHNHTIHTRGPSTMHARTQAFTLLLVSLDGTKTVLKKKHACSRSASTEMITAMSTSGGDGGAEIISAHCDAPELPSPACVPLGHLLG